MRYARQIRLKEVGEKGQDALAQNTVLVVGAGGLGSPVLLYLASAGIGGIKIVDGDLVSLSNLQRQVLFKEEDVGQNKANVAKKNLMLLNSEIVVEAIPEYLSQENITNLLQGVDCVLDGSDNFSTKYLVNDACVFHDIALVQGSIHQWEGQIGVYPRVEKGELRDIYAAPPGEAPPTCEEEGVLGPLAGMIGSCMAIEAMKILLQLNSSCSYIQYNGLKNTWVSLGFKPIKREKIAYLDYDYDFYCATEEEWMVLPMQVSKEENWQLIDVRETYEIQEKEDGIWYVPVVELRDFNLEKKLKGKTPVFQCGKGKRSKAAALWYRTETKKESYYLKEEL